MVVIDRQSAGRQCATVDGRRSAAPALLLVATLCAAVALAMTGSMAVATILPALITRWSLPATAAGWLVGVFFVAYAVATPLLACLSDRVDPRRIVVPSCLTGAIVLLAADGLLTSYAGGLAVQALLGLALAGCYVPCCRIAVDQLCGTARSRGQSWLSATLIAGNALSVLLAGLASAGDDGATSFGLLAAGPLLAGLLVAAVVPPAPRRPPWRHAQTFDVRPLLREPALVRAILAFGLHCFESYGLRGWLVTFLALAGGRGEGISAATAAALIVLFSGPAAILGNELALRLGRRRVVAAVMAASAAAALLLAARPELSGGAMVLALAGYAALTMADAGTLTSATIDAAPPERVGGALALQATLAFLSAAAAPVAIGVFLDAAGGVSSPDAWRFAFLLLASCGVLGALLMAVARPAATARR